MPEPWPPPAAVDRHGVLDFAGIMAIPACLMHWYISMLYVVPVLAVGGWGWWSSRRLSRDKRQGPPSAPSSAPAKTST